MSELIVREAEIIDIESTPDFQRRKDLWQRTYCPGASDDEMRLFMTIAHKSRLSPEAKQIFAIKRDGKFSFETSIGGLRLVAERTGKYRGQVGPWWCGPDGVWKDVWLSNNPPSAAKVGVLKEGFAEPLYGIVTWNSYKQVKRDGTLNAMWRKYPDVMLAKCAESSALRRSFPNEMGGLYTTDEMGSTPPTTDDVAGEHRPEKEKTVSSNMIAHMFQMLKLTPHSPEELQGMMKSSWGIEHTNQLDFEKYKQICKWIESRTPKTTSIT